MLGTNIGKRHSKRDAAFSAGVSVSNATKPDNKTTFKTQQECAATCIAPPPPPLSAAPCIRFGHAIPVRNTAAFAPFYTRFGQFTKTGSGQAQYTHSES
jgi:hypothetical protein